MTRNLNCVDGKPHDWGSWEPVTMLLLDEAIPPGEPPHKPTLLASHNCARCSGQEMLYVPGGAFDFVFVGPVAAS